MSDPEKIQPMQVSRDPRGCFAKGQSGNPRGKLKGTRSPALAALDAIGEDNAADVLRATIAAALEGDTRAQSVILDRLWPARKGRPVVFDFVALARATDLPGATAAIALAVSKGSLTPPEGEALAAILEIHRRAIETADLESRIERLEQSPKGSGA